MEKIQIWVTYYIFRFGNSDGQAQNQQGTVYGNDDDDEDLYG